MSELTRAAQFVGGTEVTTLEEGLQKYLEVKHAVSCANGTDAIQLALRAVGVGAGCTVLVPDVTFWATFEAVVNVGGSPVTIDVDLVDGGVDVEAFERAARELRPKAAILAHLYGWGSAKLSYLRSLCHDLGIALIEDGAQAFGVKFQGEPIFKSAHISTTSFYPAKVLGAAGDGGAVFTNDSDLADKVRMLSNHGRTTHYGYGDVGWNSRLDTFQAAYLNIAMDHVEARIAARREAVAYYRANLPGQDLILVEAPGSYFENGYCNVCLVKDAGKKALLEAELRREGIGFGNIYPSPMSSQPGARAYHAGHVGGGNGGIWCSSVLNLPMFPYMTQLELNRVVEVVRRALES